jgi:hypothetical protein
MTLLRTNPSRADMSRVLCLQKTKEKLIEFLKYLGHTVPENHNFIHLDIYVCDNEEPEMSVEHRSSHQVAGDVYAKERFCVPLSSDSHNPPSP